MAPQARISVTPSTMTARQGPAMTARNASMRLKLFHHRRCARRAERGELATGADRVGHVVAVARRIAEAGEEIGLRCGEQVHAAAPASTRLTLECGDDGGAHADLAQRRQCHDRAKERVVAVNLE